MKRAIANDGPRMKRIRPAPMGRAFRYQRRISHIEIALAEKAAQQRSRRLAQTVTDRQDGGEERGRQEERACEEVGREESSGQEVCRQEDDQKKPPIGRGSQ